ncbi:MAG: PASTA domain-containing protein [Spirochaetes bacterium]|nr:PASTA domain-containing protein [Spirochaetota bacterium]
MKKILNRSLIVPAVLIAGMLHLTCADYDRGDNNATLFTGTPGAGLTQVIKIYDEEITVNVRTYKTADGFTGFVGKDLNFVGRTGAPDIPYKVARVILPPDADLSTVRVFPKDAVLEKVIGAQNVRPTAPPMKWDGTRSIPIWPPDRNIVEGRDIDIYGKNALYPESVIGRVHTGMMRGWKIATIPVALFQYNPATGELLRVRSVTPEIRYSKIPGAKTKVPRFNSLAFQKSMNSLAVNYTSAAPMYSMSGGSSWSGSGYAIITTNAIIGDWGDTTGSTELLNFISHKDSRGFTVYVATEDKVYVYDKDTKQIVIRTESGWWDGTDDPAGDPAAESIRAWLVNNWAAENLNLEYVLLIGNPDPGTGSVPMKKINSHARDTEYIPSDYYYADLNTNWDLDADNRFGEFSIYVEGNPASSGDYGYKGEEKGIDGLYEVVVGRIPFYGDMTDLDGILTKTINYQTADYYDTIWRKRILLPMVPSDAYTHGYQTGEAIKNDIITLKSGWSYYRIYNTINNFSGLAIEGVLNLQPPVETSPCNNNNVINVWRNYKPGVVAWWTHGAQQHAIDVIQKSELVNLSNDNPAFIFQCTCRNAWPEDSNNLSYSLLKTGGIGTIGGTRDTIYSGDQGSTNKGIMYEFAKELIRNDYTSGYALSNLRDNLILVEGYAEVAFNNLCAFNLYGDPEVGLNSYNAEQCPNPADLDSDDDGIPDNDEDINRNGIVDPGETDPCSTDTDKDGLQDGTEMGLTLDDIGPDTDMRVFIPDSDPSTVTDPAKYDTDEDGLTGDDRLADGIEDSNHNGALDAWETDPADPDTDGDGIKDGVEDINLNGVRDEGETSARDADSDDDGIPDGVEDLNRNGVVDEGETDPLNPDSDGDMVQDGTEMGLTHGDAGPDTDTGVFIPDSDPSTVTDPALSDSDGDGAPDGIEDANHNGSLDYGEADPLNKDKDSDNDGLTDWLELRTCTDPNNPDTDGDQIPDGIEDTNKNGIRDLVRDKYDKMMILDESDPCVTDSDGDGLDDNREDKNLNGIYDNGETYVSDADSDDDGVPDGIEDANQNGTVEFGETGPINRDLDQDGLQDGLEFGYTANDITPHTYAGFFKPDNDPASVTDPVDKDSDDDGISDGVEDQNKNGRVDPGETDPNNPDTDGDGIQDGTEKGLTLANICSPGDHFNGTDTEVFIPDADPETTTDPLKKDSDGDGIYDGVEDANHNGMIDAAESDPGACRPDLLAIEVLSPEPGFIENMEFQTTISARITNCGSVITDALVDVTFSNGDSAIDLFDDGNHGDGEAGDGVYAGTWTPVIVNHPLVITISASKDGYTGASVNVSGSVDLSGYEIAPENALFGSDGGQGSIEVSTLAGSNWTAVSNNGFITIVSGGSGPGNGIVQYTVEELSEMDNRSGSITVAGKMFPINQSRYKRVICAGDYRFFSISSDHKLKGWGSNNGLLGTDDYEIKYTPVTIGDENDNWISIATGSYHTLALKNDGTLWAWGNNESGQLGEGTITRRISPVRIGSDSDWLYVSAGDNYSLGIKTDGSLWAWGKNNLYQLGTGDYNNRLIPYLISDSKWKTVSAGFTHSLGIKADGTLWSWGQKDCEDMDSGNSTTNNIFPIQIGEDNDWVDISSGKLYSLAIKSDGSLWVWGQNGNGQLGNGSYYGDKTPAKIEGSWLQVSAGSTWSYGIRSDHTLWVWGESDYGLGTGSTVGTNVPVQIGDDSDWLYIATNPSCSQQQSVAQKNDGTIWTWGYSDIGGGDNRHLVPIQVVDEENMYHQLTVYRVGTGNGSVQGYGIECGTECKETYIDGQEVTLTAEPEILSVFTGWTGPCTIKANGECEVTITSTSLVTATFDALDLPNTAGDPVADAIAQLEAYTYNITVVEAYDNDTPLGCVISQSSEPGSGVTLVVSRGKPLIPNLFGMTWSEARQALTDAGLTVGTITERYDPEAAEWLIIEQSPVYNDPEFESGVPVGTAIDLTVSKGSPSYFQMAAGFEHTLAVKSDGTLWAWGKNDYGQLGDDSNTNRNTPVSVGSNNTWVSVAGGCSHSLGIQSDGSLWAWGANFDYQLGIENISGTQVPLQIGSDTDWMLASAASNHSFAIKRDGTLWAWGFNMDGRLGDGTQITWRKTPVQIGTDNDWLAVDTFSSHTLAIKEDGTLWAWGSNTYGQLGLGDYEPRISPTQVGDDRDWVAVSVGWYHSMALKANGKLYTWGKNTDGQLGLGDNTPRFVPEQVGGDSDWESISAGGNHSTAVKTDDTLYAWGRNGSGQLGTGDTTNRPYPTSIAGTDWEYISAGNNHTGGLRENSNLFAWGLNYSGQIGDGTNVNRKLPVQSFIYDVTVPNLAGLSLEDALELVSLHELVPGNVEYQPSAANPAVPNNYIISQDPAPESAVANGTTVNIVVSLGPAQAVVPDLVTVPTLQTDAEQLITDADLDIGVITYEYSYTVLKDYVISQNPAAGTGADYYSTVDLVVSLGPLVYTGIATGRDISLAIKTDNSIWAWGYRSDYDSENYVNKNRPYQTHEGAWKSVQAGIDHILGLKIDGTVWVWDKIYNDPVQVGSDSDWDMIASGEQHKLAKKTDGTLWAWGFNAHGQLGDGTNTYRDEPVQVGSDSNWIFVTAGGNHTIAIKSDHSLWTWGNNNDGQLGLGDLYLRNTPTQVGESMDWVAASGGLNYSLFIKSNGTMWGCGANSSYQLGDGTNEGKDTPVQVNAYSDWDSVSAGVYHSTAVKTDGSLWAWGWNGYGQLGDGTNIQRLNPVRVGLDDNWAQTDCGLFHTVARKSDGSVYAWGGNTYGQVGDGTYASKNTPIFVDYRSAVVPDLVNTAYDAQDPDTPSAFNLMSNAGVEAGEVTFEYNDSVPAGYIISQYSPGGTKTVLGAEVDLTVSSGPNPGLFVRMPDLVGMTYESAAYSDSLAGAGIINVNDTHESSPAPAGEIIEQTPLPGDCMLFSLYIDIVVSLGPEPTEVPDVTGLYYSTVSGESIATEVLTDAGYVIDEENIDYEPNDAPAGFVIEQTPSGGEWATPGTTVDLTVSSGP